MARCEDYPCCGHDAGECPTYNSKGERMCCECHDEVALINGVCSTCQRGHARRYQECEFDGTGQDYEAYN